MDLLRVLIFVFLFSSCAKVGYLIEQGKGQLSLEYNDVDVDDFLKDPKQDKNHQKKVKIILKAKKFFYKYFSMQDPGIYDEVKILDQDAVTYLVIHSPKDKVKAMNTWFPIMGNFPYLGFFSKESAKEFKKEKEEEGFSTYMRPVYAYSTLNHPLMPFDDNILSSFFHYKERDLVELIFHELTHTIFFVGDNVGFNENLANFIAEKLLVEYYSISESELNEINAKKLKQNQLMQEISQQVKILNQLYKENKKQRPEEILSSFLREKYKPKIKTVCEQAGLKNCWPVEVEWNNARFAAFATYSNKLNRIEKIYEKSGLSLKDFVNKLLQIEDEFDESTDFLTYLENRL